MFYYLNPPVISEPSAAQEKLAVQLVVVVRIICKGGGSTWQLPFPLLDPPLIKKHIIKLAWVVRNRDSCLQVGGGGAYTCLCICM